MVNGLNINDEINNNSQLDSQLGVNSVSSISTKKAYTSTDKNFLVDEASISDEAFSLYQKDQDIQKFTKLATSDPNDNSAETLVSRLLGKGVCDPYSEDALQNLAGSSKLKEDLGLG